MRLMKFLFVLILSLCIVPSTTNAAKTPEKDIPISLQVNGSYIKTDAKPYIVHDTTYVPIRFVSEALGAEDVSWDARTATATIRDNGTVIQLKENQNYAKVNGHKVPMRGSVQLTGGRTFVPVRFIAENLNAAVDWDNRYFIVHINKDSVQVPNNLKDNRYTTDEIFWLARIIEAESSGEPVEGQVAVGNVILNRVNSSEYPNTIYDVIFDRNHGVQFQPILNGSIYNTPSTDSIISAKRALEGVNYVGDSLFFLNPRISTSFWIINNRPYHSTIHNHDFYL